MNPLKQLWNYKQSFWLDNISRSLLSSGELKKLVEQDGLRGMTSNPTIFEKAISAGHDYDADLKKLALKGASNEDIFEALAVQDIQKAADILRPVFNQSKGTDGFVSLEVNPLLAYSTEETISEAKKLVKKVKRPNLMIKVPATEAGLPAIYELLAAGISINITLLFSVDVYKKVLEAYVSALEKRVRKGLPIKNIASVASFFVSRVDSITDKQLEQKDPKSSLLHKAAIANAKLAYGHYLDVVKSARFQKLLKKGAQVQRLLWASTSAKDKRLHDVIYIEELIGEDTVNTMPPQTVDAFRDHGVVEPRIMKDLDKAADVIDAVKAAGVDFDKSMKQLEDEGVKSFSASFESLMHVVGAKREALIGEVGKRMTADLGDYEKKVKNNVKLLESENAVKRIWAKDAAFWKSDESHQKIIQNSLGWLTVMDKVQQKKELMDSIVADIRKAKFTHILLLGMGGSSLCPEVLRLTFGRKAGYPDFAILDSTEPASVQERASRSAPEKTLYIVASKSGSTTEPNAFFAYFYDLVRQKKGDKAGENFIAITDPGTSMEKVAKEKKFRHIVLNPADIGGRYSALSFFGMLPAALMGIDVKELLTSAKQMADACSEIVPLEKNPGVALGSILGTLANAGRNKVTFFLSKEIGSFSTWVEQLIAESTGKEGKGILPVESEKLESPESYGDDRVFVSIQSKSDAALDKKFAALKKAGHPTIRIQVPSKYDVAAEFFHWEFATAIAGKILGIDPFDQPNVQESKDLTKKFLEKFRSEGKLDEGSPVFQQNGVAAYANNGLSHTSSLEGLIQSLLSEIKPGDYVAFLAYLTRNEKNEQILNEIRQTLMKAKHIATTVGFGPRFLHSTGQLHKGGDNSGVFLQITADDKKDLPIPGEPYSYSVLKEAQALGDLEALQNKNRRAVRLHFKDSTEGLTQLRDIVKKIVH